jgi:predicted dehydrogenase
MAKELNVGLIGYGFMGRTHSNAYRKVSNFFDLNLKPVLKAVCGRDEGATKKFAEKWGYESTETDWRKVVERKDIDAVDICTPNNTHKEIAIAAAKAGKMVLCEKPLSMDTAEGEEMVSAIEKAGVPNTVWYNYRRVPAVTLAKQLIDAGKLGKIFHYRANFLQDWTISADLPQGGTGLWRLDVNAAGSGVTGDLLAHCIDTAMSASTTPARSLTASRTDRSACSNPPATPVATRRSIRWRSMASTRRSSGTCTTCTGCNTSTTATRASSAGGGACT